MQILIAFRPLSEYFNNTFQKFQILIMYAKLNHIAYQNSYFKAYHYFFRNSMYLHFS
jgi:hypothetical protein